MKLYPVRSIQFQIGKDIRVKLQTSPSVKSNFKGAEQILRPEGVADGSHHEVRGKWKLNAKTGVAIQPRAIKVFAKADFNSTSRVTYILAPDHYFIYE